MTYKKVFNSSRYHTKAQNSFVTDARVRKIYIGSRTNSHDRFAYIGKIVEQGKASNILDYDIYCDVSYPHVVGIFGSRGSGKSFDLGVFLEGVFIPSPAGAPVNDAGIVFDIQDQFWTLTYQPQKDIPADRAQIDDLAVWGLTPTSLPALRILVPLSSDTPVPNAIPFSLAPAQLSSADWLAILELERFSAMGQALLSLLDAEGPRTPSELVSAMQGAPTLANFQQSTLDGIRWRLEGLEKTRIIATEGVDIDDLLRPGSLSVVLMRNLTDSTRGLIVGVIARLVADRMGRVQQQRKVTMRTGSGDAGLQTNLARRLWMVLDEAHVLVPPDGTTAATEPLIDYVKRGRDAGLSLVFATQQPSAVNTKLMSQVDLTITHTLGFEIDLAAAVARMPTQMNLEYDVDNQKVGSIADVIRSLRPGEAIVADSASGRAFVAKIRPRVSAHGGATPL